MSEENTARRVKVELGADGYDVLVGPGLRARAGEVAARVSSDGRVATIADARVLSAHGPLTAGGPTLELDGGEGIKTLPVLGRALEFCAEASLSRGSALVAYGGGTVGDLAGLCAALFKRGLPVVQVPTTLLAQVDASVGGKTAINLDAGKNLAGAFHQPSEVLCDTEVLTTLDDAEYASGLGEVIKTAVLAGEQALAQIEASADAVAQRDPGALVEAVELCVRTKAAVVAEDPLERGPRRALNLGHTFGHAIEHVAGYGAIPHGVAVAVGIDLAARAARSTFGADGGVGERARALCRTFGLPGSLTELRSAGHALPADQLIAGLAHDKKSAVGAPEFVLPRGAGDIALGVPLGRELLETLFA